MNGKKRIAVCIPLTDNIKSDFFLSFLSIINENINKYDIRLFFSKRFPLDAARNELVEKALVDKPDYLWFIDSDMLIPPSTLDHLVAADKDIVSALYFQRKPPFRPVVCMFKDGKYRLLGFVKMNMLLEVDIVGFGCVLIKRNVIEKMKEAGYKTFFEFKNIQLDATEQLNEDMIFCENARKLGFKVFINSSIVCKHIGEIIVDEKLSYLLFEKIGMPKE